MYSTNDNDLSSTELKVMYSLSTLFVPLLRCIYEFVLFIIRAILFMPHRHPGVYQGCNGGLAKSFAAFVEYC